MKKMRFLSLMLSLMMVASCIITGYAEGTTYTEGQLLEGLAADDSLDFTQMTTEEIKACIAANTRLDVSADGGAKLSINHGSTFNGEVQLKDMAYSRANTKAVKFTFVAPDAGSTIDVSLFSDNTRLRLFTYNYNGNVVLSCSKNFFSGYAVTPGVTYSVIAKKVGADTVSVYAKNENDLGYTEVLSNRSVWVNDGANAWADASKLTVVGDAQNDYAIFKDITYYIVEPTFAEADILNGFVEDQKVDFNQMTDSQIAEYGTSGTNAVTTKEEGLKLSVGDDTTKTYGEIDLGLTHSLAEGEAVKVSFMPTTESNDVLVMTDFQGNGERLKVRTEVVGGKQILVYHTGEGGSGSARGFSNFEVSANKTYDIIAQKNSGKIDLYAKESTDSEYRMILSQQMVYAVPAANSCYKLHISGAAGSSAVFKGVTTYAKEVVPYTEAEVLGDSVKAYSVDFTIPGSTGVQLANLGAAYNISADASLLEYTATEEGLKISDNAKDDAFPGFEFQKTGFLPKLENGAIKLVVKPDATKPGQFEFAFNSATENFSINADITEDLKLRVMMQDKSYYTDSTPMTPGVFYTYIFKRNANNGKISCFVKSAGDTYYREIITFTPPTATSGLIRLRGMKQVEGAYTLRELTQYLSPIPENMVLTNEAEILAEGDKMFFADSFDEKNEMWMIGTNNVSDGTMILDKETGFSPEALKIDLTTPFTVRFRHKPATDSSTIFYFRSGDKRVYLGRYPRELYVGNSLRASNHALPQIGVWYEYLFNFDGTGKVDIYNRREGVEQWSAISTNLDLTSGTNGELTFGGVGDLMDDLSIFHGAGVKLYAPILDGNQVKLNGYIAYGTPESTYDRRGKVLVAAYNKEYGYTEKIWTADVIAEAGEMTDIGQTFVANGIGAESNLTAMVWDDDTTMIPLSKAAGYLPVNNETEASTDSVTYKVNHNEVLLKGFIGKGNQLTATLVKGAETKAAVQLAANKDGMVDSFLAIDPAICASGDYTVRLAYSGNAVVEYPVTLACNDIGYESFDDSNDIVNYVNQYMGEESRTLLAEETFAQEVYTRFAEFRSAGSTWDFYGFRTALEKAIKDAKDERDVVALVNAASREKKWSVIKTLVTETYKDFLGTDVSLMNGVVSQKDMFLRMTSITYTNSKQIVEKYIESATEQKKQESGNLGTPVITPGAAGGGGAGGGGFGGGSSVNLNRDDDMFPEELLNNTQGLVELQEQFPDLDSVPWAVDSINTLQRAWIISGDENGNFNPNSNITREEFLKILMGVAGISGDTTGDNTFADVDETAWYFGYVNAAYKAGIVNGVSESEFGIGAQITRADMAVMMKRMMDYTKIEVRAKKPAFIFDDFEQIPAYARESISCLSEAELLNGMGENRFMPMANTTRAEAAVAICRIYELLQ